MTHAQRCGPAGVYGRTVASRLALLLCLLLAAGCTPYRMGAPTLFPCSVRTVYVPVFNTDSFRRQLGERLTEAVVKEVEQRTPYKVVSNATADSVLSGKIVSDTKRLLVEAPTDEPRESELNFQVQVSWIDRQGRQLQPSRNVPLPADLVQIGQSAHLIPELGQTVATAQQAAIDRLAQQIVALMEAPW